MDIRSLFTLVAAALFSFPSHGAIVSWDLSGVFTDTGVFRTFEVGDPWSLSLTFDDAQIPDTSDSNFKLYTANASFVSNSYVASDTSTTITISDAPNQLVIELGDSDANIPDIEFVGNSLVLPGTPATPEDIFFSFEFVSPGSEDIADYIQLDTLTPTETYMVVRVTSALSPFGSIDNITVNAVPVPAAAWLFGSGLIGLVGVARRKKA
jgi:hypothetical protein